MYKQCLLKKVPILDLKLEIKSSLYPTRIITPKRVTSGGAHLRGLAPGQCSSGKTSQRWQVVGDTVSDLTGPGIEPTPPELIAMYLTAELTGWSSFRPIQIKANKQRLVNSIKQCIKLVMALHTMCFI